jgi:hypothetical protein
MDGRCWCESTGTEPGLCVDSSAAHRRSRFTLNSWFDILRPLFSAKRDHPRGFADRHLSWRRSGGGDGLRSAFSLPISQVTERTEGVMAATIGEFMAAWFVLSVPLAIAVGRFLRDQNQSTQR